MNLIKLDVLFTTGLGYANKSFKGNITSQLTRQLKMEKEIAQFKTTLSIEDTNTVLEKIGASSSKYKTNALEILKNGLETYEEFLTDDSTYKFEVLTEKQKETQKNSSIKKAHIVTDLKDFLGVKKLTEEFETWRKEKYNG